MLVCGVQWRLSDNVTNTKKKKKILKKLLKSYIFDGTIVFLTNVTISSHVPYLWQIKEAAFILSS